MCICKKYEIQSKEEINGKEREKHRERKGENEEEKCGRREVGLQQSIVPEDLSTMSSSMLPNRNNFPSLVTRAEQ